jgi:hypothetical protein
MMQRKRNGIITINSALFTLNSPLFVSKGNNIFIHIGIHITLHGELSLGVARKIPLAGWGNHGRMTFYAFLLKELFRQIWLNVVSVNRSLWKGGAPRCSADFTHPLTCEKHRWALSPISVISDIGLSLISELPLSDWESRVRLYIGYRNEVFSDIRHPN